MTTFLYFWATLSWIGCGIGMLVLLNYGGDAIPVGAFLTVAIGALQGTVAFGAAAIVRALEQQMGLRPKPVIPGVSGPSSPAASQ